MRARKPCFLMRRVLRGRYAGPMETPREAGKLPRCGRARAVVCRCQEARQQRPQMDFFVAPRAEAGADKSAIATSPLNERYTFETFVIGKSNELAAASAHAVAEAPGKTYNLFFDSGATGLGKTHLMQAIA